MNDKWEACNQWSIKMLTCPRKHLDVIKFLAIHSNMEAYTLWWNGEWGHISRNVDLQHEIFAHFGQSNVIVARKVGYGKANMTCHL
jgi:hypothetical protein